MNLGWEENTSSTKYSASSGDNIRLSTSRSPMGLAPASPGRLNLGLRGYAAGEITDVLAAGSLLSSLNISENWL